MLDRPIRVLVVDDDANHLDLTARSLRSYGIEVTASSQPLGVSNIVRKIEPDVVLLDVNIPALPGDRLLSVARRHAPKGTQFVLYSACDESRLRRLASEVEADGWISKSTEAPQLAKKIEEYSRRRQLAVHG